jgi:hypothetical protein
MQFVLCVSVPADFACFRPGRLVRKTGGDLQELKSGKWENRMTIDNGLVKHYQVQGRKKEQGKYKRTVRPSCRLYRNVEGGDDIKSRSRLAFIVGIEDKFGGFDGRHRRMVAINAELK